MAIRAVISGLCVLALAGCGMFSGGRKSEQSVGDVPVMRWDHRPEATEWTRATMTAVGTHGASLLNLVPADIAQYCPAYPKASAHNRAAFWSGLLSALAKHESTWNPTAAGGGGRWIGLTQIAPQTAKGYGCGAQSSAALKDGAANLSCAVRIMASTVSRDGVISRGGRGVAADWAPFHNSAKLKDMKNWTKEQAYCAK